MNEQQNINYKNEHNIDMSWKCHVLQKKVSTRKWNPKKEKWGKKKHKYAVSFIYWMGNKNESDQKRSKHFKNEDKCNLFFKRNFQQDVPNRQTSLGFIMIHREKKVGLQM